MSEAIKLNLDKENTLAFQVNISGIETDDVKVRFAIDTGTICYTFPCEKVSDENYRVHIPELKHVPHETFDCMIEVVANEFYFIAMNGKIKVVGTPKIKAKLIKKEGVEDDDPPIVQVKASPIKIELVEAKKQPEKDVEDEELGDEAEDEAVQTDPASIQADDPTLPESKDDKVRRILGELGYNYEPVKPLGKSLKSYLKG